MQIRVAGPAVPMGERGRDQAPEVDLPDPLLPGPSEQGVLLNKPQGDLHRCLVGPFDHSSTAGSATAHRVDTDFTAENVKS